MICAACGRKLTQAAGFIGLLPIGPVCFERLRPKRKPGKTVKRRKVQAERQEIDQLPLNFGEPNGPNS